MSTLIKRQVLVLGLAIVLAAPVYSQADTGRAAGPGSASASRRHIHFTHVSLNNNSEGRHRSYTLRATDVDGNTYRFRKSDDQVVEFEINGKPVPRDQYAQYEEMFDELATPPTPPVPPVAPVSPAAPGAPVALVGPAAPVAPVMPATPAAPVAPAGSAPGAVPPVAPAAPVVAATIPAPPVSPLPPTPPTPPEPPRANKYISRIIDELIDKGIITDDSKLTFLLDNEAMTVNGVKQPDEVFQAFKKKYIKHTGDHFSYERSGSSAISSIKIEDDNH